MFHIFEEKYLKRYNVMRKKKVRKTAGFNDLPRSYSDQNNIDILFLFYARFILLYLAAVYRKTGV